MKSNIRNIRLSALQTFSILLDCANTLNQARHRSQDNGWKSVSLNLAECEGIELIITDAVTNLDEIMQAYDQCLKHSQTQAKISEAVTSNFLGLRSTIHSFVNNTATLENLEQAFKNFKAA